MWYMHEGKCEGKCLIGTIVAIIFGALFIWTLVTGFLTQAAGGMASAFAYYLVALVFLVIAKLAKWHAMSCGAKPEGKLERVAKAVGRRR